ncbi:hypothetical protein OVV53_26895, partial [Klebsiella pneumoniae]|nr:hypothetical protein [Klebsiella pneumoniae]
MSTLNFNRMKSILYTLLGVLLCLSACKKNNIEQVPLEKWTDGIIFDPSDSLGNYAKNFLNDIYTGLPTG